MVKCQLAYGKGGLEIALFLAEDQVAFVEPTHVPGLSNQVLEIKNALRNPTSSDPLRSRIRSTDHVGIVVNDITWPTLTHHILSTLLGDPDHAPAENITIFIATGT
jgi:nickel-dependent lactate racemase